MNSSKAMSLQEGAKVSHGNDILQLVAPPEMVNLDGVPVVRLTTVDDFFRTRIVCHNEVQLVKE